MLGVDKYSAIVESLLFYESDVVSLKKISEVTGLTEERAKDILDQLKKEYDADIHGLTIVEVAGGYTFQIKREIFPFLKEYYNLKSKNKLSKSVLTVLSIIAYKQPITKNEIEDIRGVNSDNAIKRLLELNLIKIAGRKDVIGKPLMYGTTDEFLKYFNLKDIKDLPRIDELKNEEFSLK